ncbi:MAG: hypothetical protein RJQ00_03420 [Vicingaceae bacterium]
MLKKISLSLLFIAFSTGGFAQLAKDVFPLTREFKKGGFYIAPLATVSIGNKEEDFYSDVDTTYSYEVIGRGKWGYGIELGWYHSFKEPYFIHYLEAGVSYRVFRGAAEHEGTLDNQLTSSFYKSDNTFSSQHLSAAIRAVNAKQLGKKSFLSTALGVNFNYEIAESYDRSDFYPLDDEAFLNETSLQLHLQMGVGFRVSRQLILMPTIETPLITALPFDNLNPAFPFFSANYQPIIIGLRFMFIREDPMNCNAPVYDGIMN